MFIVIFVLFFFFFKQKTAYEVRISDWSSDVCSSDLRLQLSVGSHVPLHCTAMGKLFLSQMPKRARERLYIVQPLQRFTENTITDPATLEGDLAEIRRKIGRAACRERV